MTYQKEELHSDINNFQKGQCGGIGRHAGFKIRFLNGSDGSSPSTGTMFELVSKNNLNCLNKAVIILKYCKIL